MKLTASQLADFFINYANERGSFISNLKLQKLVYYAQAWHLAVYEESLIDEEFQAWVHGPVVPSLYHQYKHFSWRPIDKEVTTEDIHKLGLDEDTLSFLVEVADEFMKFDAVVLEKMTHQEKPWLEARGDLPPDESCTRAISEETMKEYYAGLYQAD